MNVKHVSYKRALAQVACPAPVNPRHGKRSAEEETGMDLRVGKALGNQPACSFPLLKRKGALVDIKNVMSPEEKIVDIN